MTPFSLPQKHAQADWVITDPGDAGYITNTQSGVCNLVSGALAQTRTIGAPEGVGQEIVLNFDTDGGGNIVVTSSVAVNATGNNTITFADKGEAVLLKGVTVDGALRWSAFAMAPETDGPALSTVA